MTFSRSIYIVANGNISFFFLRLGSIPLYIWTTYIFFIQSSSKDTKVVPMSWPSASQFFMYKQTSGDFIKIKALIQLSSQQMLDHGPHLESFLGYVVDMCKAWGWEWEWGKGGTNLSPNHWIQIFQIHGSHLPSGMILPGVCLHEWLRRHYPKERENEED